MKPDWFWKCEISFREIDKDRGAYAIIFKDGVDHVERIIEVYMNPIIEPMNDERIDRIIREFSTDIIEAMRRQSEDGRVVHREGYQFRDSRID